MLHIHVHVRRLVLCVRLYTMVAIGSCPCVTVPPLSEVVIHAGDLVTLICEYIGLHRWLINGHPLNDLAPEYSSTQSNQDQTQTIEILGLKNGDKVHCACRPNIETVECSEVTKVVIQGMYMF